MSVNTEAVTPESTNAMRILGWKTGLIVLVIDMFKGWLAVNLIHLTQFYIPETGKFTTFQLMLGVAAILGHIFPIYVGFKGGKGVATLFGLVLAINPEPTLICTGIFVFTLILSKYVSLSSMIAGFSFPHHGHLCFQGNHHVAGNILPYHCHSAAIHPPEEHRTPSQQ